MGVLTGSGGTFSAGADLEAMDLEDRPEGWLGFTRRRVSKPTVAAVEGHCVAGGLEMALWCQLPTVEAVGLSVDSRSADTYWSDATSVAFTVITPDFRAYRQNAPPAGDFWPPLEFQCKFPSNTLRRRKRFAFAARQT